MLSQLFRVLTAPFRMLFAIPMALVSAPRRLLGLSLPARVAVLTFLLLLGCAAAAFVLVWRTEDAASSWNYWMRWETPLVFILLVVIPLVVYYSLRSWLEGEISLYPDIDEAWKQGVAALREQGLDLTELPLFLILGSPDERATKALLSAAGFKFLVRHVPAGHAPLHWYADEDGVFLVCQDAGQLGRLNGLAAGGGGPVATAGGGIRGTLEPSGGARGTMVSAGAVRDSSLGAAVEESGEFGGGLRGTLVAGAPAGGGPGGGRAATPAGGLSRREADEQSDRLRYVCRWLVRTRQPLCPLNGILTVLPFSVVSDVMAAKDLPGAVQQDLQTIRRATRLHCSVTALVTGLEAEPGFSELVRRVGSSRAGTNRFGKGYHVWNPPTAENIDAFSAHACGAFEDWVYNLFREKDGLHKPGNAKLYALLCKIRSQVRARLRNVLLHGYSFDPSAPQPGVEPLLFSGCYFAATGETGDRQAFVKNVFEKMRELEEELDWTEDAWRQDDRYHAGARVAMGLGSLLVAGLIAMLVYKFSSRAG